MTWRSPRIAQQTHVALPGGDSATDETPVIRRELRLVEFLDRIREERELFLHCVETVQDLMTTPPGFLTLDDRLSTAMRYFETNEDRCVSVLDDADDMKRGVAATGEREFIGVVSRRDVARILSHGYGTLIEDERDESSLRERLVAIVTRKPTTATPHMPLVEAIRVMVDEQLDFLPVVDSKTLVGTLSICDVVRCFILLDTLRILRQRALGPTRLIDVVRGGAVPTELLVERFVGSVVDVMQPQSEVAIHTDDTIDSAIAMMEERHLRNLLVVNSRGRLKGVISDRDIMSYLPVQSPYLFGATKFHGNLFRLDRSESETVAALQVEVRLAMTGSPITVEPTTSIAEVAQLVCAQSLDAVPVVDDAGRGKALGIVTDTDFLRALFGLIRLAGGDLKTNNRR